MKFQNYILTFLMFFFLAISLNAQDTTSAKKNKLNKKQTKKIFVDKNKDGYNDNAPDHDGDGIPNGLDPDFLKMKRKMKGKFIDMNGNGINDYLEKSYLMKHKKMMMQKMMMQKMQNHSKRNSRRKEMLKKIKKMKWIKQFRNRKKLH